jgi:HAD superfamily hydrolase (TIGR01490 family)
MSDLVEVVFFDMDHTLMDNDCDVSWKEFLIDEGIAPESEREDTHRYFDDYISGGLDYHDFLDFQLKQFRGRTPEEVAPLAEKHFSQRVEPRIYPQAKRTIEDYQGKNIPVVLLTATNGVVARPVAGHLNLAGMLATELEMQEGRFTGRIVEPYCYREYKIEKAEAWCRRRGLSLKKARYYGDSTSDIPMLESVASAVMINPEAELEKLCRERGWDIQRWAVDHQAQAG